MLSLFLLPDDVISFILKFLVPQDLISLSQTCKEARYFFTHILFVDSFLSLEVQQLLANHAEQSKERYSVFEDPLPLEQDDEEKDKDSDQEQEEEKKSGEIIRKTRNLLTCLYRLKRGFVVSSFTSNEDYERSGYRYNAKSRVYVPTGSKYLCYTAKPASIANYNNWNWRRLDLHNGTTNVSFLSTSRTVNVTSIVPIGSHVLQGRYDVGVVIMLDKLHYGLREMSLGARVISKDGLVLEAVSKAQILQHCGNQIVNDYMFVKCGCLEIQNPDTSLVEFGLMDSTNRRKRGLYIAEFMLQRMEPLW